MMMSLNGMAEIETPEFLLEHLPDVGGPNPTRITRSAACGARRSSISIAGSGSTATTSIPSATSAAVSLAVQ